MTPAQIQYAAALRAQLVFLEATLKTITEQFPDTETKQLDRQVTRTANEIEGLIFLIKEELELL